MLNGTITVESEIGQGSAFTILIKEVEVATTAALEAAHREKQLDFAASTFAKGITFEKSIILIADDIDYNRELLKGFLAAYPLTLLEAENGRETLALARQHQPDLILLDMKMPEMDGYEAVDILKQDQALQAIPVIAVTASVLKQDEAEIRRRCDSYLRKPISKTSLLVEVMKFLPHTIIQEQAPAPEETPEKLSPEILGQHPELLGLLKTKRLRCRELSEQMEIDDIEAFANEIKELGRRYNCRPLAEWANALISSALEFDDVRTTRALLNLQTIIEQYEEE